MSDVCKNKPHQHLWEYKQVVYREDGLQVYNVCQDNPKQYLWSIYKFLIDIYEDIDKLHTERMVFEFLMYVRIKLINIYVGINVLFTEIMVFKFLMYGNAALILNRRPTFPTAAEDGME